MSIGNSQISNHLEMLKNAPVVHAEPCTKDMEFKESICPFKDVDTVRYQHINEAPVHNFRTVKQDIDNAIRNTFVMGNMVAIEDTVNLDFVIKYEYLDGIGGTLAQANYPSCNTTVIQTMTFDNYDVPPGDGTPDSILVYYPFPKDIASITAHEVGHLLGFQHNRIDVTSMMYPYYKEGATWSPDDKLGFYLNFAQSYFILINKEDNYAINNHFNINEFFSKCSGMNYHMLDRRLLAAARRLREEYRSSIIITSTYRHESCNEAAGGVKYSRHRTGQAVDLVFTDRVAHARFVEDVNNNKYIVTILKALHINMVGLYNKHVHLDTREGEFKFFDKTNTLLEGDQEICEL